MHVIKPKKRLERKLDTWFHCPMWGISVHKSGKRHCLTARIKWSYTLKYLTIVTCFHIEEFSHHLLTIWKIWTILHHQHLLNRGWYANYIFQSEIWHFFITSFVRCFTLRILFLLKHIYYSFTCINLIKK
jgi:hypothetical protein